MSGRKSRLLRKMFEAETHKDNPQLYCVEHKSGHLTVYASPTTNMYRRSKRSTRGLTDSAIAKASRANIAQARIDTYMLDQHLKGTQSK